ncbi:PAS domain S-box protein [Fulvivirga ligni]|uniref:PAS domain S-box protein n=1 Tax=Fulvivirga ligni TaxID=2904246 RepID=UPI001F3F77A9|nr:PAS domain S-box protein [Fulvivirga ligni]UII19240.1 PAS domain S-box protein [Fulvivirga ligni]
MKSFNEYISAAAIITTVVAVEFIFHNSWLTSGLIIAAASLCIWSKYRSHEALEEQTKTRKIVEKGMNEASRVIANLGKEGERQFSVLDEENELTKAILRVDADMKRFNEEEQKRNWRIEGLAKFSELLRSHDKNVEQLSEDIITNLVRYISGNQGGLFVHKNDEMGEYLELTACYAYDKVRIREKRIEIGQGQIGQCYLEKETVYLLDVPEDYVTITSGLGQSTARNVVLVPLKLNETVYGIIELASFNAFPAYRIKFLEQLGENIASVFASMRNNDHTTHLLQEAQTLTTELQSREEEMRQNMEELSATQEEMSRKQSELDGIVGGINSTMGLIELNTSGKIVHSNTIISEILEYSESELRLRTYNDIIGMEDTNRDFLREICSCQKDTKHYQTRSKTGKPKWLSVSFSPIQDNAGETSKILGLVRDITSRKLKDLEFEKLSLVADNTNNAVIISDKNGLIEYVNKGFTDMTGYKEYEVVGRKPGSFLQGIDTNKDTISRIREGLLREESVYEEILNYKKTGESYWISMAINPVFDKDGNIDKFISIQADITDTKKQALDYQYKLNAISKSNAIVEFDVEGRMIDVNENFLKIVGYTRDEVIGNHHEMFVSRDEKSSSAYLDFWRKLKKGEVLSDEFLRIRKDGEEVHLKGIYNPIFDINGKPYKIVKFVTDITQQKILKFEKRKQEVELANQMEAINKTIATAEFDLDGHLRKTNEIFDGITGIDLTVNNKIHYSDIIPPSELLKPQTELMWTNLKDGKFFSGEFKLKDVNGKELWLVGTFNPINDISGKPYKVMMYAQFTTQEKEKQKDLVGIVNAMKSTTPVMELHPDGTFKNGNTLFMEFFGYNRIELRRKPFHEFVDGGTPAIIKGIIKEIKQNNFLEREFTFINSDGEKKDFQISYSAIYDLEDKLSKIVTILIERSKVIKSDHHERY